VIETVSILWVGALAPLTTAIAPPPAALRAEARRQPSLPTDLQTLILALGKAGFRVRLEPPPVQGVYGLFESRAKTLWIAPIALELGIGRQTLLHEATHAVQSCPAGTLQAIGWRLPMATVVRREIEGITYSRYHPRQRGLEREAFALQGQPDAVALLLEALRRRCPG